MVNKVFTTLGVTVSLLVGCSNSDMNIATEDNERILLSYFVGSEVLSKNLPFYNENLVKVSNIRSLNEEHPIDIISVGGSKIKKDKVVEFYHGDYENIMKKCKIQLKSSDVNKEKIFFSLYRNGSEIINKSILDDIDKCSNEYLENTPIKSDELAYFLSDDRIKNNIHHPFLNDSIKAATKDSKITYSEIFNIYRNLDKALEKNLSTDLEKLNSDLLS